MNTSKLLVLALTAITALHSAAQTPKKDPALVGAWQETTDSLHEIKLISPTHVFFFIRNVVTDSFVHAGAGTYTIADDQYTENLKYGSFDVKGFKGTYNYSVQNNQFKQQGTLEIADGTRYPINHTFTRIEGAKQNPGPHVGTWNQLSSTFLNDDGSKGSHTNATHIRYQIITPTHWMRLSLANGSFENAFGGTYTLNGNTGVFKIEFASHSFLLGATVELTQRMEGNKLTWKGPVKDAQGKQVNDIEDVFERVEQ